MLGALRERCARIRAFFRTSDLDRDFEEELQSHVAMLTEDNLRRGLTPEAARRAALIRVGGAASLHERHREARGLPAFETLLHDLRFASRLLVKDRWFTAAVVVALALGVGVNTTVFTVINGWNLRDLPVDEPGRVTHLGTRDANGRPRGVSYPDFLDWRNGLRAFTGLAAYADTSMILGVAGRPADHLAGCFVSANAFSALRERPIVGRDFRPEDDRPGAAPVIIIGHDVWTERFGADPSAIGRTIRVNGAPATIVGVMPPGFMFPYLAEIWQPIAQMPDLAAQPRDARGIGVFGRLADGVTPAGARAELSAFGTALAAQFPATNHGVQGTVTRFTEQYFGSITDGPPLILMVAVGFVLLIACANAANLLLARAASRAPEIALRRALGASRGRIVRQLFVESLLLAALAGVFGFLLAWPLTRAIAAETADFGLPYWARITFDGRVFTFVAAICVATALCFGVAPAWKLSRAGTAERLRDAARTTSEGPRSRRWMSGLLVGEIALSVILLAQRRPADSERTGAVRGGSSDRCVEPRDRAPLAAAGTVRHSARADRLLRAAGAAARLHSLDVIGRNRDGPAVLRRHEARRGARQRSRPGCGRHAIGSDARDWIAVLRDAWIVPSARALVRSTRRPSRAGDRHRERAVRDGVLAGARCDRTTHPSDRQRIGPYPIGSVDHRRHRTGRSACAGKGGGPCRLPAVACPSERDRAGDDAGQGITASVSLVREEVRALDADVPLYDISTLERLSQQSRWIQRAVSSSSRPVRFHRDAAARRWTLRRHDVQRVAAHVRDRDTDGARAQRLQVAWLFSGARSCTLASGSQSGGRRGRDGQVLRGGLVQTNPLDPFTFAIVVVLLAVVAVVACLAPTWRASALDLSCIGGNDRSILIEGATAPSAGESTCGVGRCASSSGFAPGSSWRHVLAPHTTGSRRARNWRRRRRRVRLVDVGGHRLHIWCTGVGGRR